MERFEKEQILFGLLTTTSNKLDTFSATYLNDLTLKQFFIIQYIYFIKDTCKEKGSPYIKEIAEISGTTRQNIKQMVNSLHKKGYINLEKSKIDNRALCVSLTQKSLDFINNNNGNSVNFLSTIFQNVSDTDLDSTIKVLSGFIKFLEGDKNG